MIFSFQLNEYLFLFQPFNEEFKEHEPAGQRWKEETMRMSNIIEGVSHVVVVVVIVEGVCQVYFIISDV